MRIVHVITRLIIGGAQENTLWSCEGQHDLGHDVTLITGPAIGPEGSLMKRASEYGYRVETVDGSAKVLITALLAEVEANKGNPAALQALVDRTRAATDDLVAAIPVNTPAEVPPADTTGV